MPPSFAIRIRRERHRAVVLPRGEIDISTVEDLARSLEELRCSGWKFVVVDLSGVSFIDATGLGALLRSRDRFAASDAHLSIANESAPVRRLLEITNRLSGAASDDP